MTPDRLRGWLKRPMDGTLRLQLCHDALTGLEPIADWSREEIEKDADDLATSIIEQTQEHANAQDDTGRKYVTFALRWLGDNDRVLKDTRHRVKPSPVPDDEAGSWSDLAPGVTAADARALSQEVWIKELLRALLDKDRQLNEAYKTSLQANKETIAQLSAQSQKAFKLLEEQRAERHQDQDDNVATVVEVTPEQREESRVRTKAWETLNGLLPEIGELAILAATKKLMPPKKADEKTTPTNGASAKTA